MVEGVSSLESTLGDRRRPEIAGVDVLGGIGVGVVAFVVGYGATGAVAFVGQWPTQTGIVGALKTIGFAFYSAHNVRVGISTGGSFDFLGALTSPDVPIAVYYAIPILVLLAAGVLVTRRDHGSPLDPVAVGATAASIAAGYVVVAVLGRFVFVSGTLTGGTASLVLVDTVLFYTLYPLVFATIGGALSLSLAWYRS